MDPLFVFGIGTALVGCGATGTTWQACREILAIPDVPGSIARTSLLGAMIFILVVDLGIVAGGLWVAIAIAGGAHG
ncbi:hypothetical protein FHT00_001845 [Sphingomonas insulae]|uniref:Uncharacterized protein n=1 Tax=Sphingomonas insulae TaxID=424800 RepID=A0ABN1HX79_9SPHN|nr:hypothetical protein [Sphingomonas insulae]NIJ29898.1 hypothetical protein [Sphingomonas insulae]